MKLLSDIGSSVGYRVISGDNKMFWQTIKYKKTDFFDAILLKNNIIFS